MWAVAKPASSIARSIASGSRSSVTACSSGGPPAWPTSVGASTSCCRSSCGSTRSQVRQVSVKPCRSTSGVPAPPRWDGVKVEGTARQLDSLGLLRESRRNRMGCARLVVAALVAAGCVGLTPVPARAADPCRRAASAIATARGRSPQCRGRPPRLRAAAWPCSRSTAAWSRSRSPTSAPLPQAASVQTLTRTGRPAPTPRSPARSTTAAPTPSSTATLSLSVVPWSARGYTYFANVKRMPHGDRDRRQITKGKHTWDKTRNGCGFGDATNFKTRYGGRTIGHHAQLPRPPQRRRLRQPGAVHA